MLELFKKDNNNVYSKFKQNKNNKQNKPKEKKFGTGAKFDHNTNWFSEEKKKFDLNEDSTCKNHLFCLNIKQQF